MNFHPTHILFGYNTGSSNRPYLFVEGVSFPIGHPLFSDLFLSPHLLLPMLYKSWVGGLLYPAFQADKSVAAVYIHTGHYVLQAQITAEAYLTLAETNNYCRTIHRLLYNETLFLLQADALQCPKPVQL